jgi:ketosteroid isomerase-like protein
MIRKAAAAFACFVLFATGALMAGEEDAIASVLDLLHEAASRAEGERYFALFADDAIFFGTDAEERWTVEEFRGYAEPFFEQGQGWTYRVEERHVFVGPGGHVAWFDEDLFNEKYGRCRGTGVLTKAADGWKISQYNLTIPIPNDLASAVVEMIRSPG